MKIYVGPYLSPITLNWHKNYMESKHGYCWDMNGIKQTKFERGLEKFEEVCQFVLRHTINPILNLRKRKIKVKLHNYDTWGMFSTLAIIILPMLKQLKETKQGSPWVDDADVPDNLGIRSIDALPKKSEHDLDENVHKRWEFVLGEMIWAFEQIVDDNSEDKFFSKDFKEFDKKGHDAWYARKHNGLKLFGKFYESLWD
jgi:hypothetical protein